MTALAAPPLEQRRQPGLSVTLPGQRDPDHCQSCSIDSAAAELRGWIECDEWDKYNAKSPLVMLCESCARRLIGPHPRLYVQLEENRPWPGAIWFCALCKHRSGLACTHPNAKANGGAGVVISIQRPITAFVCGSPRARSGPVAIWRRAATSCAQHEGAPLNAGAAA